MTLEADPMDGAGVAKLRSGGSQPSPPGMALAHLAERLSSASVTRRWEAYRDVDWDDSELAIDPDDHRLDLPTWNPLGATSWYHQQTPATRSRLGLFRLVVLLKVGIEFEAVLQQGLLDYAATLPDGDPCFRYAYHEISEEAQHTLMFQEFVKRSGVSVLDTPDRVRRLYATFAAGRWDIFFLAALTAEHVFDRLQRRYLAETHLHPLFRRISEIHVAEEARHLAFARRFLLQTVPDQSDDERKLLRLRAPFVVGWVAGHVLAPDILVEGLTEQWDVPATVAGALRDSAAASELLSDCTSDIVRLCSDLDLLDERLIPRWAALGPLPESREVL